MRFVRSRARPFSSNYQRMGGSPRAPKTDCGYYRPDRMIMIKIYAGTYGGPQSECPVTAAEHSAIILPGFFLCIFFSPSARLSGNAICKLALLLKRHGIIRSGRRETRVRAREVDTVHDGTRARIENLSFEYYGYL